MKCSFCGNELPNGASFCPECGTILNLDNDFTPPAAPEQPVPAAPAPAQPPAAPEMSPQPAEPQAAPPVEEFAVPVYVSPYTAPEVIAQQQGFEPPAAPQSAPETVVTPAEEPTVETFDEDGDDMLVDTGRKRGKGILAAVIAILLLAVGAYAVKTFVIDKRPASTTQPSESQTAEDTTDDIFWTSTTEPTDPEEDATDESEVTDDTDDIDDTDETDDTDDTDETDETDDSDLNDENEATVPSEFESTTAPTTKESTTRETTTTRPSNTTTTRRTTTTAPHTTTTRRAVTTTTRRAVTTTRPSTTAQSTTVQRPATTTPRRTLYVTEDGVALRTAPNRSAASRLSLSVGADVVVTGEENGYYYVYSNRYGVSGWVSKSYIASSRPVATSERSVSGVASPDVTYSSPKSKTVASDGDGLNLRKGPGTSYGVIRSISDGYPVLVKGTSSSASGWVYVTDTTHGVSGWVSAAYLK